MSPHPTEIHFIRGQGGAATSEGVDWMARQVEGWGLPEIEVNTWDWGEWQRIVSYVNHYSGADRLRLAVGYSMGGNALTWVLGGVTYRGMRVHGVGVKFDYCWFLDPTWASVLTPISPMRLKALTHFQNHSLDPIGHADLLINGQRSPALHQGANRIEGFDGLLTLTPTYESHLWVDKDSTVRAAVLGGIRHMIAGVAHA